MAAPLDPDELVIGRGWMFAHYPRVQCAYFGPNVDDRSFDEYLEAFVNDITGRSRVDRIGVLYYAQGANMDSPRRRRMAKVLDDNKDTLTATTAAYALATNSAFVRGVLSTLFWLAPPGYPYKVVGTVGQGLEFIEGHVRGIDSNAVEASFTHLLDTRMRVAS